MPQRLCFFTVDATKKLIGFVGRALPPSVGGSALDVEADTFSDAFVFVVSGEISLNFGFSEVTLFSLELLLGLYPVVQFQLDRMVLLVFNCMHAFTFLQLGWEFLYCLVLRAAFVKSRT